MAPDEAALLERWTRRRDAEAFNELFRRFADPVYSTCRRILRNDADAEEVAQECFLALVRSGGDVRTSLGGWLHRVATTKSLDRIRRDASRRDREQAAALPHAVESSWDDIQEHVDGAIETLPDDTREMIVAHFLEGLTHQEIAARAGLSRRAVSYRIQGGLEAVRSELLRRGVTVSAVALGPMLAQGGYAAPATLQVALGKLAIAAGPGATGGGWLTAVGGVMAMKAKVGIGIGIGVVALAALIEVGLMLSRQEAPETGVATPEPDSNVTNVPTVTVPQLALDADQILPETDSDGATDAGRAASGSATANAVVEPMDPAPSIYPAIDDTGAYASVSGVVLDQDGYPVSDALVTLAPAWSKLSFGVRDSLTYTSHSDRNGHYAITGIASEGPYTASATKAGFVAKDQADWGRKGLSIAAGDALTDVNFLLEGGLTFTGRVVTADGKPVPAALVDTVGLTRPGGEISVFGSGSGTGVRTDAAGAFAMGFQFSERGNLATFEIQTEDLGRRTFPGIPIQDAEPVEFVMNSPGYIHGTVRDTEGAPVAGARLSFGGWHEISDPWADESTARDALSIPVGTRQAESNPDGTYRVAVESGVTYKVHVTAGSSRPQDMGEGIPPLSPGELREYNPTISAGVISVRGRIVGEDGARSPLFGAAGARVGAHCDGEYVGGSGNLTDDTFAFTLPGRAGTYVFTAHYGSSFVVRSDERQSYELQAGDEIDLTLYLAEPQIFSVLVISPDGQPVEGASLTVLALDGERVEYLGPPSAATDSEGREDRPLAAAPESNAFVRVTKTGYAVGRGAVVEDQSPGAVHPVETIVLYPAAGFEGDVVDEAGRPVANAALILTVVNGAGQIWPLAVETDARGHFTVIDEAPADAVEVSVGLADEEAGRWSGPVTLVERTITGLGTVRLE